MAWAGWHVQVFADPLAGALFTVSCVALSIVYAEIVTGDVWQRGLVAGFMHAVVNISMFLAIDPAAAWVESVPLPLVLLALCASVAALARRHRRRSPRNGVGAGRADRSSRASAAGA